MHDFRYNRPSACRSLVFRGSSHKPEKAKSAGTIARALAEYFSPALFGRRQIGLIGVHELDSAQFGLQVHVHQFALCSAVAREAQKVLVCKMVAQLIEIGLERDRRGVAEIKDSPPVSRVILLMLICP